MGIKNVVSVGEPLEHPYLKSKGSFMTREGSQIFVYGMKDAQKIVFLADQYRIINTLDSLKMIQGNESHPWINKEVYLEKDPDLRPKFQGLADCDENEEQASIVRETYNQVDIKVNSPKDQFLVLSYLYRPSWKAKIGNTGLKVLRAYGGFMTVEIPRGKYIMTMKYIPVDVFAGLAVSILVILLALFIYGNGFSWARAISQKALFSIGIDKRILMGTISGAVIIVIGLTLMIVDFSKSSLLHKAEGLFDKARYQDASGYYSSLADQQERFLKPLADCYLALGKVEEALKLYERLIRVDPPYRAAYFKAAQILQERGEYDQAVELMDKLIAFNGKEKQAYIQKARILGIAGKYDRCVSFMKDAAQKFADDWEIHFVLGKAYFLTNANPTNSINELKIAQAQARGKMDSRQDAELNYMLALSYERSGDIESCLIAYRSAEDLNSEARKFISQKEHQVIGQLLARKIARDALMRITFEGAEYDQNKLHMDAISKNIVVINGKYGFDEGLGNISRSLKILGGESPTRICPPAELINLKEGSISIWAKLQNLDKAYSDLLRINNDNDLYLYHGSNGIISAFYNGSRIGQGGQINDTGWHHYAFTWKNLEQKLYIDGSFVLAGSAPASSKRVSLFALGWLGSHDGEQWNGSFAEIMTFGRALSNSDIKGLYSPYKAK
jgi:tetratricopeptide (TPR) repeat protein